MLRLTSSRMRGRRALRLFAAAATAVAVAAVGSAPHAQESGLDGASAADLARYADCISLANRAPERALETAAQWRALGGGGPARHCRAIALIAVGAEASAAAELTELGVDGDGLSDADRSAALALAGELWLRQEQPELARRAFTAAIEIGGASRRVSIGWARAAAMEGDWAAAAAALDPILAGDPSDVEALTLRAAARRSAGDAEGALDDAIRATDEAPDIALAWFERGAAERAVGDPAAARRSWLRASLLDPEGPNGEPGGVGGELARRNLQLDALGD